MAAAAMKKITTMLNIARVAGIRLWPYTHVGQAR